eukprot:c9566_g1_i2.p1 GENE.c9566_g1_i2~~c9566_g1_i2.p1  ORF type:complete len:110 (+),score=22.20 c9566_g1_i2:298-627(+)
MLKCIVTLLLHIVCQRQERLGTVLRQLFVYAVEVWIQHRHIGGCVSDVPTQQLRQQNWSNLDHATLVVDDTLAKHKEEAASLVVVVIGTCHIVLGLQLAALHTACVGFW